MEPLLALDALTVAFPANGGWAPVVRGLSLAVGAGELVGLVGESGCGKSVTAAAIVGLVPPPGRIVGGDLRLAGTLWSESGQRGWRRLRGARVGLVFQEPSAALDPSFTVGAQLVEAIRAHRPQGRRAARRRARELLARVAMDDPETALAAHSHRLSGGQRQRATIALALAGEPDLLVADEPTTALDVTIQAQILELLRRLRRELGLAILLITHDLAVVAETCDRVVVMYAGEAVEQAPVERLFRHPAHPYTRALLAAVPRIGQPARPLAALAGRVPHPGRLPAGCAFHPRCPEALAECRRRRPEPLAAAPGHEARCLLLEPAAPPGEGET